MKDKQEKIKDIVYLLLGVTPMLVLFVLVAPSVLIFLFMVIVIAMFIAFIELIRYLLSP